MTITNRAKVYENISGWGNILSRARNQRDIVDLLAPDEKVKVDGAYQNVGLLNYQTWNERPEVLKNSIKLALKAHTNTKDVMMLLFDAPVRPIPSRLMGKFVELSREDISEQITGLLLKNPKAVGFQLSLKNDTEYELNMLVSTNDDTRDSKLARYQEIQTETTNLEKILATSEETSEEYLTAKTSLDALKEEADYNPVYIIRYERA